MTKKAGILIALCCFFMAALPVAAPAGQLLTQQSLAKKNITALQDSLLAAALTDSTPLLALTVQFLDDVQQFGFKKDTADLELAVAQYVADMQDQVEAAALDPACVTPLVYNIYTNGTSMLQTVTAGGDPVCLSLRLSMRAASIISAQNAYATCSGNKTAEEVAPVQNAIRYYSFIASVLEVVICNPTAGVQTYIGLVYNFLMLFLFQ